MAIIHQIGTPENDSEAQAINRFANDLPDDYFVFPRFRDETSWVTALVPDLPGRLRQPSVDLAVR